MRRWCLGIHLHQQAACAADIHRMHQNVEITWTLERFYVCTDTPSAKREATEGIRRTPWRWPMEAALGYSLHWPMSSSQLQYDGNTLKHIKTRGCVRMSVPFDKGSCLLWLCEWQQPLVLYHDISTSACHAEKFEKSWDFSEDIIDWWSEIRWKAPCVSTAWSHERTALNGVKIRQRTCMVTPDPARCFDWWDFHRGTSLNFCRSTRQSHTMQTERNL